MRSTLLGIREFKSSSGWLDIRDIIDERIKSIRDQLENEADIETLKFHQGCVHELRLLKDYPDIISEELEDQKENK